MLGSVLDLPHAPRHAGRLAAGLGLDRVAVARCGDLARPLAAQVKLEK